MFNYSEYNLFNVQRLCVLGPIILIAHGCLHRHMRSHMRLYFCVFLDSRSLTDNMPQFNQVQPINHMRLGGIMGKLLTKSSVFTLLPLSGTVHKILHNLYIIFGHI